MTKAMEKKIEEIKKLRKDGVISQECADRMVERIVFGSQKVEKPNPEVLEEKIGTGDKAPETPEEEEEKPEVPEKKDISIEEELSKFKFEKYNGGNCNWSYYKEVRKAFCYRCLGCKVWRGTVTKPDGWKYDENKWDEAKKAFEAKFPYIKKADRK